MSDLRFNTGAQSMDAAPDPSKLESRADLHRTETQPGKEGLAAGSDASLDIEAPARTLRLVAFQITNRDTEPERNATRDQMDAESATTLRALASALPGMAKNSERLAKLVALAGDKDDRGVVTLGWENGSCCVWAGDDGNFQESVGFGDDLAAALDDVELEDDDNADSARAAQPEETRADATGDPA